MGRIIAIDYGLRRCGLAWTDPLRIIATGLGWVETAQVEAELKKLCAREAIDGFLLGLPTHMDGNDTDATPHVRAFAARLGTWFPGKSLEYWDERFTSRMAVQAMVQAGVPKSKRREKGLTDQVAATLMLQEYLASR